ncbi:MAG: PadR family transcriptional regulator [Firmicutes bacterium]|nr:PadR family transcriptional regulator [Bacillota bacterium]
MADLSEQSALTEGVYLILLSMLEPRHGYAVMQYIGKLTKGRVLLGAGTLYGAINTLLEKQWIRAVGENRDSRKKAYVVTELGRKILRGELSRLEELLIIGKEELGDTRS